MQLYTLLTFTFGAAASVAAPVSSTNSADGKLEIAARSPIQPATYSSVPANPDGLPLDPCSDKTRFDGGEYQNLNGFSYKYEQDLQPSGVRDLLTIPESTATTPSSRHKFSNS